MSSRLRRSRSPSRSSVEEEQAEAPAEQEASFDHLKAIRNVQLIRQNEYPLPHVPRERLRRLEDSDEDANVCMCTLPDEGELEDCGGDVRRCDDVSCLNFATYVECGDSCPVVHYCRNQRLQHPERFPALEPFLVRLVGGGRKQKEKR
jgi:hypothetical protein